MATQLTPGSRKILEGTIALFQDPTKHTKGSFARDRNGAPVSIDNPEATCFCFIGGMEHVSVKIEASSIDHMTANDAVIETLTRNYPSHVTRVAISDEQVAIVSDADGNRLIGREAVIRVCQITLTAPEHGYVG